MFRAWQAWQAGRDGGGGTLQQLLTELLAQLVGACAEGVATLRHLGVVEELPPLLAPCLALPLPLRHELLVLRSPALRVLALEQKVVVELDVWPRAERRLRRIGRCAIP